MSQASDAKPPAPATGDLEAARYPLGERFAAYRPEVPPVLSAEDVPEAIRIRAAAAFVDALDLVDRARHLAYMFENLEAACEMLGDGMEGRASELIRQSGIDGLRKVLSLAAEILETSTKHSHEETASQWGMYPERLWPERGWPLAIPWLTRQTRGAVEGRGATGSR